MPDAREPRPPHVTTVPLRWADMDQLGHVNNVTYLEYAAAGRADLFAGHPAAHARVISHRLQFVRPLVFRRRPVHVATAVVDVRADRLTLHQEVYDEPPDGGDRVVHLLARTELSHRLDDAERAVAERHRGNPAPWREAPEAQPSPWRATYPVALREADLGRPGPDGGRTVSDVAHFELFQESRISYLMDLHERGQRWSHHVVANSHVEFLGGVDPETPGLAVRSRIGHLGTRSFSIVGELHDERERVLATSTVVMVAFDAKTQRPGEMAPDQRERLEREISGSG